MSILISGMEMPTHCIDCPFMVSRDGDDCILQSAEANANFENWEQMKAGCPLVPVPPHGRLIDGDALAEHKFVCIPRVDLDGKDVGRAYRLGWNNAIEAVMENAKTIIGGE